MEVGLEMPDLAASSMAWPRELSQRFLGGGLGPGDRRVGGQTCSYQVPAGPM